MCKAYGGEPSVDLLRSFLNLGRAGDWLTLSSRGGADVPKALTKTVTLLPKTWKRVVSSISKTKFGPKALWKAVKAQFPDGPAMIVMGEGEYQKGFRPGKFRQFFKFSAMIGRDGEGELEEIDYLRWLAISIQSPDPAKKAVGITQGIQL
ncbi:hypothetical protein Tco_0843409 [Tanacetum coccineum]|uniref:Uncharacterized protein n=1 Tax=Tanacetum coccineum TaxID=301880 RepID=A0ABQ5B4U2_9ASTR